LRFVRRMPMEVLDDPLCDFLFILLSPDPTSDSRKENERAREQKSAKQFFFQTWCSQAAERQATALATSVATPSQYTETHMERLERSWSSLGPARTILVHVIPGKASEGARLEENEATPNLLACSHKKQTFEE